MEMINITGILILKKRFSEHFYLWCVQNLISSRGSLEEDVKKVTTMRTTTGNLRTHIYVNDFKNKASYTLVLKPHGNLKSLILMRKAEDV